MTGTGTNPDCMMARVVRIRIARSSLSTNAAPGYSLGAPLPREEINPSLRIEAKVIEQQSKRFAHAIVFINAELE